METARDVLTALARRYAFGDLEALITQGTLAADGRSTAIAALCAFGQRVLDLDAEDFGMPEAVGEVPRDLLDRARASRMPQTARRPRGALASLRPAYSPAGGHRDPLVPARHGGAGRRRPHRERVPADAGVGARSRPRCDPALIGASVSGAGSRFGVPVEPGSARMCDHTRPERSACERTLRVAREPAPAGAPTSTASTARSRRPWATAPPAAAPLHGRDPPGRPGPRRPHRPLQTRRRLHRQRRRETPPRRPGRPRLRRPVPEEVQTAWTRARKSLSHHPWATRPGKHRRQLPAARSARIVLRHRRRRPAPRHTLHDVTKRITSTLA